jgi:SAM-dependent methyltransferase
MNDVRSGAGAGDADYGVIGAGYASYRQADPRIAARILSALGPARTVLNVGAGAGSYEPTDRDVTAVEPSAAMRAQRPPHLPAAIDAVAERLPFPDQHFDASMTTFSVHQWPDLRAGLAEMRRVTRGPVVILTNDPSALAASWLHDYVPEVTAVEASRYPPIADIVAGLGGAAEVIPMSIPLDCRDGFNEAYYGRPERLLEDGARRACSGWSFVAPDVVERFVRNLSRDLADGAWDRRYGHLRTQPEFAGPLRLIVGQGQAAGPTIERFGLSSPADRD